MKNVYLRSDYSIKKISLMFMLSLVPLIIGGFYKNGIKLYNLDLVGIYGLFKPLIITSLGLIIGILVNLCYEILFKKQHDSLVNTIFSSFHPLYGILIASIISINTNLILFIIVTFIVLFISKFIHKARINIMALTALIIILIINLASNFSFLNTYESSTNLNLNTTDYLLGMGSGGINTTYVILLLISLIILCNQEYYKKSIPLFNGVVFAICMFIYCLINNNIHSVLENIFVNGYLFSFIYLGTDPLSSSYTRRGKAIFGILIGLLSFSLFLIYPPLAAIGGILITSVLHEFIDKLCLK